MSQHETVLNIEKLTREVCDLLLRNMSSDSFERLVMCCFRLYRETKYYLRSVFWERVGASEWVGAADERSPTCRFGHWVFENA
jgi:hypothetical protein